MGERKAPEHWKGEHPPARNYKWADATPGNFIALKHGANSPRKVSKRAQEVRALLLEHDETSYLANEVFTEALERYCRAEARALLLHEYAMQKAEAEGVESVKPWTWQEASRAENNAHRLASDLGLDAAGYAKVARDLGLASTFVSERRKARLEAHGAKGAVIRDRRLRELK